MSDITLAQITSGYNLSKINSNFTILRDAHNDVAFWLSGGNNTMLQDIDLNGFDLLNVGEMHTGVLTIGGVPVVPSNLGSFSPNSVGSIQIIDGAVTTSKVADGSITDSKIVNVSGSKATFQQIGTGTVIKDLQSKAREIVSIKDWGAVGDGVADDTAAIQAAINSVIALGGGSLYVPDGRYLVTSTITVGGSGLHLFGSSKHNNTFTIPANATGFTNAIIRVSAGSNNTILDSLGIDGNIANNASKVMGGIFVDAPSLGTIIKDCWIRNVIYDCIRLYSAVAANTHNVVTIQGNRLENTGGGGISLFNVQGASVNNNYIFSSGNNGIAMVESADLLQGSNNIRVSDNYINRSVPPTFIASAVPEAGFMIVFGAQSSNIIIANNICYDNRNAKQDAIGLGQDGVHTNIGCIVEGNVVWYAGLFGIDATYGSTIQNNIIIRSAQCGIKLGTDLGGPLRHCKVSNNLIINANESATPGQEGIWIASAVAGAQYEYITIEGNTVIDDRGTQTTKYGMTIDFTNITFTNCTITGNNFRRVSTSGFNLTGTLPTNHGWSWYNNALKGTPTNDFKFINSATPNVFGYENMQIGQGAAVTVTNFVGGFEGQTFTVQHNDGNTTYKFAGSATFVGNGGADITVPGNGVWRWWRFNGNWYAQKIN